MQRVAFRISLVLLSFFFAAGSAAMARTKNLDAPPEGLTPTAVTLAQILKTHDASTGKRNAGIADTSSEVWSYDKAGLQGTETLVRSGNDYYARMAAGPLVQEYGQFIGRGWHRDENGIVSPVTTHDITSFEMLLFTSELNDAADPKNDVTILGQTGDAAPEYVLSIKRTGFKHPEFAYYNVKTGLVDKVSFVSDDDRVTISYGDYRATKGLTEPWHVHFTDGTPSLDYDFTRKSLVVGAPVDAMKFTIPTTKIAFQTFHGPQKLPTKVFWDRYRIDVGGNYEHDATAPTVVVRLNVNGRGLDFAVSAGEPQTLIDFDVARELGLPAFGQTTHADGENVSYDTILPAADVGGLMLRNLAVRATPFHYHLSDETKVVGVIGVDVLSSGVFKIDYENGTMDLYPASDYDNTILTSPNSDAYTLPVIFDSGYPFFQGVLDSNVTQNILFDNDFSMSYVFGSFIDKHPASVSDVVTGHNHGSATIPFADSKGFGKEVSVFMGKIPDVQFGPARFLNYQIVAVDGDMTFGGHDTDAVMGGDLLRFYDIYLDYPHNRIFLKPNASFFKNFKTAQ